jgi:hypothetical protein
VTADIRQRDLPVARCQRLATLLPEAKRQRRNRGTALDERQDTRQRQMRGMANWVGGRKGATTICSGKQQEQQKTNGAWDDGETKLKRVEFGGSVTAPSGRRQHGGRVEVPTGFGEGVVESDQGDQRAPATRENERRERGRQPALAEEPRRVPEAKTLASSKAR